MQENIRLVLVTVFGIALLWFVAMTVNKMLFVHTNVVQTGTVAIASTDIGTQCDTAADSVQLVEYKMNLKSQVVYLCPATYWPIQKQVVANSLSANLKALMGNNPKLELLYPSNATIPAATPVPVTTSGTAVLTPNTNTAIPSVPSADTNAASTDSVSSEAATSPATTSSDTSSNPSTATPSAPQLERPHRGFGAPNQQPLHPEEPAAAVDNTNPFIAPPDSQSGTPAH